MVLAILEPGSIGGGGRGKAQPEVPLWLDLDVAEVLAEALGHPADLRGLTRISERPGRRVVLRAVVGGPRGTEELGIKFRRRRAGEIFDDWRRLAAARVGFALPEPIGFVERANCIVYRWASGPGLLEALRADGARWTRAAAKALAALHASGLELRRRFDAGDELAQLDQRIAEAEELNHPRVPLLRERLAELEELAAADGQPLTTGHRDFYPRQVLATEPLTLLDLDQAALCELPLDVGNFAAHLVVDGEPELVEPFVKTALGDGPALRRREEFYRRATLARLSALYWIRGWRERALSVPLP